MNHRGSGGHRISQRGYPSPEQWVIRQKNEIPVLLLVDCRLVIVILLPIMFSVIGISLISLYLLVYKLMFFSYVTTG